MKKQISKKLSINKFRVASIGKSAKHVFGGDDTNNQTETQTSDSSLPCRLQNTN